MSKKFCIDCNKRVSFYAIRCKSCAHKGENHPNWKGGIKKADKFCIDCGKKLGHYKAIRCNSCAKKGKYAGENHPMYGKKHTEETKNKIKETLKGKLNGKNNPNYGKKHSEETKRKIGEANKGKKPSEETKRKMSKSHKGIHAGENHPMYGRRGEKSPTWKGGLSFEEYGPDFNSQLKVRARVRDNFICQLCGIPELELNRKLDMHHIDYDKKNNSLNNLISLCNRCHTKTNYNRSNWIKLFITKVGDN